MSEYVTENDIYDKNGILLLGKGQRMTDNIIAKLKSLGRYIPEEDVRIKDTQRPVPVFSAKDFGARRKIKDNNILKRPNQVLSTIIFEYKTKPWWIYVNALMNYVDWLYTHSIDVAMISLIMGAEQGYNDEELFNLGLGAFLHDVGKLLIPKSIIQKPRSLTDMEMAYMRQHCELGITFLEQFQLPKECTDIVLQHHERLDGSGYPNGLKSDEISHNAKIVMIADVADAITSGRPYKKPKEMDGAIKILRNEGDKYPQDLIDVLEKILK